MPIPKVGEIVTFQMPPGWDDEYFYNKPYRVVSIKKLSRLFWLELQDLRTGEIHTVYPISGARLLFYDYEIIPNPFLTAARQAILNQSPLKAKENKPHEPDCK